MATFEAQVHGLTNLGATLSGSTFPTDVQLDQFLKDGVIDVTQRSIVTKPMDHVYFIRSSSESTSQYGLSNSLGKIISVVRESGTDADWKNCRVASIGLQSELTDVDSLHFASKYNPAYVIGGDGSIGVFPVPSGSNNAYKVYYINSTPVNTSDAALLHSHSDINYFPEDKVYLVVIYAAIKSLHNKMSSLHADSGITTALAAIVTELAETQAVCDKIDADLVLAKAEVVLAKVEAAELATQTDNSGTMNTAADAINTALGRISTYNWSDSDTFDSGAAQLTRVKNALNNAENLINSDQPSATTDAYGAQAAEDVELVGSALNIAGTEINRAQTHLAEWKGILQAASTEAQGFVGELGARASFSGAKTQAVQGHISTAKSYVATAQGFASEVQIKIGIAGGHAQEVQTRMANLNQEYQWYSARYKELNSQYDKSFAPSPQPQQPQQAGRGH